MTSKTTHKGTLTRTTPVADHEQIVVSGGDLIINAPIGNHVTLAAEGSITITDIAGDFLRAVALTDFTAHIVGEKADMTALNGKAAAYTMGSESVLRGRKGAAITSKDDRCGRYDIDLNGFVSLRRKPDDGTCAIVPPQP